MIERRIKELSFALEALSRVNHYKALDHFDSVADLLKKAIDEAHKEANPPVHVNHDHTDLHDEIPF